MERNVALYRWFRFFQNLTFWQAVRFLYFQSSLSAAQAILLYAIYDVATMALEVPSGYLSDRMGRRRTLLASSVAAVAGVALLGVGGGFGTFVLGQVLVGAGMALSSGTDSALLYESLESTGRTDDIEREEMIAWRFSFTALALSAVTGGVMAWFDTTLPFWATAVAGLCALALATQFREPGRAKRPGDGPASHLAQLGQSVSHPVLAWLLILSVLMYGFGHLPFVFGQPFILEALARAGWAGEAPVVSGAVTATMMVTSVLVSLVALRLRRSIGLAAILMLAFAMQVGLNGVLALTNSVIAIGFLFLRMVPDALSTPFIIARAQPLLQGETRATFLSVQSFCSRLVFAAALYLASLVAVRPGNMAYNDIQTVLGWAVVLGVACLAGLALMARRVGLDRA